MTIVTKCDKVIRMVWATRCERDNMMELKISPLLIPWSDCDVTPLASVVISLKNPLSSRLGEAS